MNFSRSVDQEKIVYSERGEESGPTSVKVSREHPDSIQAVRRISLYVAGCRSQSGNSSHLERTR